MAGGVHVVEEVHRQSRKGKHQQPQHSEYVCHHNECGAQTAATHGAPKLSKGLLGSTGGVEALRQQHNAIEEEEGGQTIDDILEILNYVCKGYVVLKVSGKISLDESFCLCERLVSTATEQCDARETQQCRDQGAERHSTQTAHATVIAAHVCTDASGRCWTLLSAAALLMICATSFRPPYINLNSLSVPQQ